MKDSFLNFRCMPCLRLSEALFIRGTVVALARTLHSPQSVYEFSFTKRPPQEAICALPGTAITLHEHSATPSVAIYHPLEVKAC